MVRLIVKQGKWEPETFCIDPDKLDKGNPVDALILKELSKEAKRKRKRTSIHLGFDASGDEYDGDIAAISNDAIVENDELVLWLTIDYCG